MGLDQFPMFRLATLLARQLSSPIASRIKSYATRHPVFQRTLIVSTGRAYRAAELRCKMWMLRLGRPPRSPPLSEHEATQVGADIIGEMIVFCLGASIVVFEVNRQAANKELKELEEHSHWVAILVGLEELQREVALQQEELDRLHEALRAFAPHALPPRPLPKPPPANTPAHLPQATQPDSGAVSPTKTPDQPSQAHPNPILPSKTTDSLPQATPPSRSLCPPKTPDRPHAPRSDSPHKTPDLAMKIKSEASTDPTPTIPDSAPLGPQPEAPVPNPAAPKKRRYCLPKS